MKLNGTNLQGTAKQYVLFCSLFCSTMLATKAFSQDTDISAIQRDLAIFSGILEESLRLNESTGLFGMSLGGVEATYLHGQGAVLEIRSPLANRRNRMGLASLSSAMQALQSRQNPFQAMRRGTATPVAQVADPAAEEQAPESGFRQLLDRIASIDYPLLAQSAVQQASQSARALRALGDVDDPSYAAMEQELADLRTEIDENILVLRDLEQEIRQARSAENAATGTADIADFASQLENALASFEPVKDLALEKARQLREQSEQVEREYAVTWRQDLEDFRLQLYESLCEYGTTLGSLPDSEHVSVVLKGLGEDQQDSRRADEVHVVAKSRIVACGRGNLDYGSLREQATIYSY